MKKIVGNDCKIKAAGGIKTLDEAIIFIEAGVDRIGTSSGYNLINNLKSNSSY
ncbi:hypothetical protein [Spiroplasma tabanidicola]|uniref:hypothetical protein n=1 Tax=Spiroplasma tabanidicola TaxID=324079 RepID=UPI001FE34F47|nr:hypothetical protein [Spiroplasma tabanidicola]